MNFITSLFTTKEIIIAGCIVGGLLLIVMVLTIMTILDKKKEDNELFEEFDKEEDSVKDNLILKIDESPKEEFVEPVLIEKKKDIPEKIENVEEVPLVIDVEEEPVKVEISKEQQAKIELEKIEEELENPKSLEDTITSLEAMEEESAIISYQELLETTKEMNIVQTDTGDEFISINELLKKYNEPLVEKEMTKVSLNDAYNKEDFTNSPRISPIEGVENPNLNEIQLENTANLEKLDKEIRKTNEFLNILNELKKNLE